MSDWLMRVIRAEAKQLIATSADVPAGGTTFGVLLGWGWPKTP